MSVVVRFAPSPTGFLHVGGARTALFNWLFARHHNGTYLVRVEDTDRRRSTEEAVAAIFEGLEWMGLSSDQPAIFQFARLDRHKAAVQSLLDRRRAYRCYCTPAELDAMREEAKREGRPVLYDGRWRDRDPKDAPSDIDPVIRFKAPLDGETVIADAVQGEVRIANSQIDDMILMRSDGTPTYMLSVVVDDIDMGITHVIRGDDHLNNAARQSNLFKALDKEPPIFAHIPLIHGPDGAKLSKRHGALSVTEYREMGYLPEALRNYLLRLGWSHGDEEIIPTDRAIELFDLNGLGRAAARFDFDKLASLNAHYMRAMDNRILAEQIVPRLRDQGYTIGNVLKDRLTAAMPGLKPRAKTLVELAESAAFYVRPRPLLLDAKAAKLHNETSLEYLEALSSSLSSLDQWETAGLEHQARALAEERGVGLGKIAQPLRAALTGSTISPGIFEVMAVLGRDESLGRIADCVNRSAAQQSN